MLQLRELGPELAGKRFNGRVQVEGGEGCKEWNDGRKLGDTGDMEVEVCEGCKAVEGAGEVDSCCCAGDDQLSKCCELGDVSRDPDRGRAPMVGYGYG